MEALLNGQVRADVRNSLKGVSDLERLGTKAAQGLANGRDLRALGRSLAALPSVVHNLKGLAPFAGSLPTDLMEDVRSDIDSWLVEEPGISLTDGGIIAAGMDATLAELIELAPPLVELAVDPGALLHALLGLAAVGGAGGK